LLPVIRPVGEWKRPELSFRASAVMLRSLWRRTSGTREIVPVHRIVHAGGTGICSAV